MSMDNPKVGVQFGHDFCGPVDVLSFDKPLVGLLVLLLEDPLRGNSPGKAIGGTSLARDHHRKNPTVLAADPMSLTDGGRQAWQMFQNMDC